MSVTLHTTLGDIKIEVFCESVPKTAYNFLALCASGYYDLSPFHRLLPTFIVQTGIPSKCNPLVENGTLKYTKGGESIYARADPPQPQFEDEIRPALRHNTRGIVSMANKGKDTNGSQFFITFGPHPSLDGQSTVFGHVLEGMDVLDNIEKLEVGKKSRPVEEVRIERVTIHANPLADS